MYLVEDTGDGQPRPWSSRSLVPPISAEELKDHALQLNPSGYNLNMREHIFGGVMIVRTF
jgi:hypothetical protein